MAWAAMFPGQGSQSVGMGVALAGAYTSARRALEEADEALGEDLSGLIRDGPAEALTLTRNTQPALVAAQVAAWRVLSEALGLADRVAYVAGHSLGEYSALVAAGSLSLSDAVRITRARGEAMQACVAVGEGAMAAIVGLEIEALEALAVQAARETGQVCAIAGDNAPSHAAVSGGAEAMARLQVIAREAGAKRVVPLDVSAPFHCLMMAPAQERLAEALAGASFMPPRVPVVANVLARPVSDAARFSDLLVEQVVARVRWRESVAWMVGSEEGGASRLLEVGPGRVLVGLAKRIARGVETCNLDTEQDAQALAAEAQKQD